MVNQKLAGMAMVAAGTMLLSACNDSDTGGHGGVVIPEPAPVSPELITDLEQMFDDLGAGDDLMSQATHPLETIVKPGTYDCDGGGSVSTNYDEDNDDNEEQSEYWIFSNCVVTTEDYGQVRIDGRVDYYELDQDTENGTVWQYSVTYDGITGEVLDTDEMLVLNGTVKIDDLDADAASSETSYWIETIDSMEMRYGERHLEITGMEFREEETGAGVEYTLSGELDASALGGSISLSTPVPVTVEDGYTCPTKGQVNAAGDETAKLLFGETALGTGAAALWIDGHLEVSYDESECEDLADLLGIETYDDPL